MNTNKNIEDMLMSFINSLGISYYNLHIWWSYFFKKDKEDFFNWKSDVDVIVVIKKTKKNIKALSNIFNYDILQAFDEWYFDILNFNHRYGKWRNVYNIKFISISLFYKIINFQKLNFKSFRKHSLAQVKQQTLFYSNNPIYPYITHIYKEKEFKWLWYELLYKCNPFQNWVYYLTDLLSMLVFSINLVDDLKIKTKIETSKWYNIVVSQNKNQVNNMLKYHTNKWILSL